MLLQISVQFYLTKKEVASELDKLYETFGPALAKTIYDFDDVMSQDLLKSFLNSKVVVGVHLKKRVVTLKF